MFKTAEENLRDFIKARYGLFIHYGLYSLSGRGEWEMNRELVYPDEYRKLANDFRPDNYDADKICFLARKAGMNYICFTTMHHDGFRLYNSELCDFNSVRYCGRDLVDETVKAARKYGLRIHLYHSLNNWSCSPDACDAQESREAYEKFIHNTFERIRELVTKYNPIDVLWYDGWWPYNAEGWQAEKMNAMVREIQPWIIFNGRNGLAGDFTTPEGHMSAPNPWRPWEACITLNENWCYVKGDEQWKNPYQVINLLLTAAKGNGNLLLDIGPKPDGSVPAEAEKILLETGAWLERNGEAVFNTEVFNFGLEQRGESRSDWSHLYDYTASGSNLYLTVKFQMPEKIIITGLQTLPRRISMLGSDKEYEFDYNPENGKLIIHGGSEKMPGFRPVFKIECAGAPEIYRCAGMRTPAVAHPPYDPCASDIMN